MCRGFRIWYLLESNFQLSDSSEEDGKTTLEFSRFITSCFFESFDASKDGDIVLVVLRVFDEDPEDIESLEKEVELDSDALE